MQLLIYLNLYYHNTKCLLFYYMFMYHLAHGNLLFKFHIFGIILYHLLSFHFLMICLSEIILSMLPILSDILKIVHSVLFGKYSIYFCFCNFIIWVTLVCVLKFSSCFLVLAMFNFLLNVIHVYENL